MTAMRGQAARAAAGPASGAAGQPRVLHAVGVGVVRSLATLLAAVAVGVAALFAAKAYLDAHYFDGYEASLPLDAVERAQRIVQPANAQAPFLRLEAAFQGVRGMTVPARLALPTGAISPSPCIVFLHGIGQDRKFLDVIAGPFTDAGFAMATFDQYMRGERKLHDDDPFRNAAAFYRRGALTVLEARRLVDYLQTRPDIAPDRIYLMGASYGAITGCTAAALDERFRAVALVYGGGDLPVLFGNRASAEELGPWHDEAAAVVAWFLRAADPIRYVGRISPRPLLFQNGTDDRLIPREAAQALYAAAGEPKSITWYEGDHIGLDEETVRRVLDEALGWIRNVDAEVRR